MNQSLNDLLNTAFDLSYLDSPEFLTTEFKSVGILGGGTAGYFAALALKKCHPKIGVTVIESSRIPVIGVGESTTTEIVPFLHHTLGFDPHEFFAQVQPTLKLGIQFDWGQVGDYKFNFNFFASHHYESYFYEESIENSNWASVLMNHNKVPVLKGKGNQYTSLFSSIPFAYHIDNQKFVTYLKQKVQKQGIEILDAEINNIHLDENGFVSSLEATSGDKKSFDFYVDCSGFSSKILGKTLKTKYISYESTLITDRALTFNLPNNNEINPFTSAITMDSGWCWKIPMRKDDHYGYVFSSRFCNEEQALEELTQKFGEIQNHKIIKFRSGRFDKAWNKNVFALGNAYAFVEPLESTAIQTVIQSIMLLCRLMPHSLQDSSTIKGLNKEIAANWDTFRSFLGVHYKFNNKKDTDFWNWARENTDIGDATEVLDLFKERPPLSLGHYGTTSGYFSHEPLVFNSYSYDTLLFGQKILDKPLNPPKMSHIEYKQMCAAYKDLTDQALTQQELYQDDSRIFNELLTALFEDPESWIQGTEV